MIHQIVSLAHDWSKHVKWLNISPAKTGEYPSDITQISNMRVLPKTFEDNKHNSLHLAREYARIFVLGHYLFLIAHSFPRATRSENCSLLGTDNVRGQISEHIFVPNGGYCLFSCSSFEHHYGKIHQQQAKHKHRWRRSYRFRHIAQICMTTFWITWFSSFFTVCVLTRFCHGAKFGKGVLGSFLAVVVVFHKLFFDTNFVLWSRTVGNFQAPFTVFPRVFWHARVAF